MKSKPVKQQWKKEHKDKDPETARHHSRHQSLCFVWSAVETGKHETWSSGDENSRQPRTRWYRPACFGPE